MGLTDIVLQITGTQDRITLVGAFADAGNAIETIAFDNGVSWTREDLIAAVTAGTDAAQTLVGSELGDIIDGAGGDDNIAGAGGDDNLIGGTGSDSLSGGEGADTPMALTLFPTPAVWMSLKSLLV